MTSFTSSAETIGVTVPNGHVGTKLPELRIEVVMISSKQAARWLEEYRGPNRRTSDTQVLRFQSDMENGRWHFEGAPLRISKTNKLLDGKHRLTALANTVPEMEIPFVVEWGLDDDAQLYMDQLQSRTVAQQLSLRGLSNASIYSAVAKLYLDWTRNRLFSRGATVGVTSKPEVAEWVIEHQELLDTLSETGFRKIDAPASVLGAFGLAILQTSPVKAFKFFEKLDSGIGLEDGDPILALDRRLRNIRRSGVALKQREYLALLIKAWNAWVSGEYLSKVHLPAQLTADNFPELLVVADEVSPDTPGHAATAN